MAKQASTIREPMAKVDTAWLRMESPTNLMMITGLMVFGQRMSRTKLKKAIAERFLAFPRFRSKAVDDGSAAFWETDPKFDLNWHVRVAKLPARSGKAELEAFVSELASTPLDHARPLWQFQLIEKYQGGSAVVARIHHCYADGLALVQVMLSLTDAAPKPEKRAPLAKAWLKKDQGGVVSRLLAPTRAGLGKMLALGELALEKGGAFLRHPALAATMAREGSEIARELAVALNLSDDPPTRFKKGCNTLGSKLNCLSLIVSQGILG